MRLFDEEKMVTFFVEKNSDAGIWAIAEKVAGDMEAVAGRKPVITSEYSKTGEAIVLFAQIGKSLLLEELAQAGKVDIEAVKGKNEVYGIRLLEGEEQFSGTGLGQHCKRALIIYGSDKRGTIYGMFHLSELMGISPLTFWGDVVPKKKKSMDLGASVEMVSKEPSVRYRGFFINDEWPCFGTWTFKQYGGFNAKMYDKVFELLLRLKGNYLWPAMWTSSFALDGPGEESARLADMYGVIMGNSHHEPCLRAGEEWDIYRGENSLYGNEWNYVTNKEGLLKYWEYGLKRSGKYENIITIGMRGERDSIMEGPQSLKENIDVLKDIITEQKKLIQIYGKRNEKEAPLLLAIYKEVEQYYYGSAEVEGLKDWEGLQDVILMFCEDNFGHMRYLPEKDMSHKGSYGMYYHLDYHGSPVSYEWINSTPLTAIWEQMTIAFEQGIRDVWMVNVGDLKGNEFPLSYFLTLAYDYDTWGSAAPNTTRIFTRQWLGQQFGDFATEAQITQMEHVLTNGIQLIGRCRPEALNSDTYHPAYEREADTVLEEIQDLEKELCELEKNLPEEAKSGFYSMIYDQLCMGFNLIRMQIYAGKNAHFARQGKKIANTYADKVQVCIETDKRLIEEAGSRNNGKWYGMWTGSHIGFTKWNEDGCRYPQRTYITPFTRPRMVVSRADGETVLRKNYGKPDSMEIVDFLYEGRQDVWIEIANDGEGSFSCRIETESCSWLTVEMTSTEVEEQELLRLRCKREELPIKEEICTVRITDEDTVVELHVHGCKNNLQLVSREIPARTYFEYDGRISLLAEQFTEAEGLIVLEDFGLCKSGVKAVPFTAQFEEKEIHEAVYSVCATEGSYRLLLYLAPSNPISPKQRLYLSVRNKIQNEDWRKLAVLPENYRAGEPDCTVWAKGVVSQIHRVETEIFLKEGINEIAVKFHDGISVLEKLVLCREEKNLPKLWMGPAQTWKR